MTPERIAELRALCDAVSADHERARTFNPQNPIPGRVSIGFPSEADLAHAARTALPEALDTLERFQWRPIETAPTGLLSDLRDEEVIVWAPGKIPTVAYQRDTDWFLVNGQGGCLLWAPTHWMPLPGAPK